MKCSRVDNLGRIVIPVNFRKALGITPQKEVEISMVGNKVIIVPKESLCRLCGMEISDKESGLCKQCIKTIKDSK